MNKDAVIVHIDGHRFFSTSTPLRIYDWLTHVGGWHKEEALAHRLAIDVDHVRRSLYRLEARGAVIHERPRLWKSRAA